jgi:hypothetical protein
LCGFPDPRIDSNDKVPNPNVTLFEWLHQKPAFKGKVAAFGSVGRFFRSSSMHRVQASW